jgi:hypothetical protein
MSSSADWIARLYSEYSEWGALFDVVCMERTGNYIVNNRFMGSYSVVYLTAFNSIIHEAPGCIGAPFVNMVAKRAISLGMAGYEVQPVPLRLYCPKAITIVTKYLSIGDVRLLEIPENGFISCQKLTLSKSKEGDSDDFELIKSWAINDDMEIEVIPPLS